MDKMTCVMRATKAIPSLVLNRPDRFQALSSALVCGLSLLMVPLGAQAGSSTYDMNTVLNEPHPFAQQPTALPPLTSTPQPRMQAVTQSPDAGTARPYQPSPVRAAKPERDDTLLGLFGFTEGEEKPPGQLASSSMAPTTIAQAAANPPPAKKGDPSFITIGGGWFDFNDNEQAAEFRVEWRGQKLFWVFKPFVGAMATSDTAFYGYAGFLTDFFFGRRIVVTPSIAAGLYEDGDGKDLGSIIEFRSGLEIGYRFDNRSRLSAMVYHISNASIDDNNPGTEVFSIGYSFPLD